MNLHGWIIYNGSLSGNKFLDYAEWIQQAAYARGSETTIYKNNELSPYLVPGESGLLKKPSEKIADYVVFADKDIYLAKQLELMGLRVFNSSQAIEISDDKIATYQCLAQTGLPIPKTIVYPKVFITAQTDEDIINNAIKSLGFPMVVKEAFGSFGEQVYLVHTSEELWDKVNELLGKAFVFQEFISSSYGRDMRLQVVGNEVVAAMKRASTNDFRANVSAGGTMEAYTPSKIEREMAVQATKSIGADFAGIDLLYGEDGSPLICEINSNAHIRNMYDCTGINVADFIMDYILNKSIQE
ncbi:RimK family alpha-L-glutamate ligase [Virgibacillus halodenitrificans]|uniref:ATP-grasp domain-containing protein n=1 Tax=Virgibacillus halodenitrificans TaxID=1482 RepID=UPI00136CE149|nr:RimK family alpha-L-glutamate ligase [Virgibacillus halodenitrificans]MYL44899.1 RimK family alpha-L-glutamate ligase [Virgibacillus halodenitrificans]